MVLVLFCGAGWSQSRLADIQSDELNGLVGFELLELEDGYLIAGTGSAAFGNGFYCWVNRTNDQMGTVWSKKFRLPGDYFQVNPYTVSCAELSGNRFAILCKSKDTDSSYTTFLVINSNGELDWGRQWNHDGTVESPDLHQIELLPNNEMIISHAVRNGLIRVRLDDNGNQISGMHFHETPDSTLFEGLYTLNCNDGGFLQVYRYDQVYAVAVRLNADYQVSWSQKIEYAPCFLYLNMAVEHPDGSFTIMGGSNCSNGEDFYRLIHLDVSGNLVETNSVIAYASFGFAQLYQNGTSAYDFCSSESAIGTIDFANGTVSYQDLDIFQANHGFQNLHRLNDGYAMTGMGANWQESKIHLFPSIGEHPCLQGETTQLSFNPINMQDFSISNFSIAIDSLEGGLEVSPEMEFCDIHFLDDCFVGIDKESQTEFQVYPNPVSSGGKVVVKSDSFVSDGWQLRTLDGSVICSGELKKGTKMQELELGEVAPGMYILYIGQTVKLLIY